MGTYCGIWSRFFRRRHLCDNFINVKCSRCCLKCGQGGVTACSCLCCVKSLGLNRLIGHSLMCTAVFVGHVIYLWTGLLSLCISSFVFAYSSVMVLTFFLLKVINQFYIRGKSAVLFYVKPGYYCVENGNSCCTLQERQWLGEGQWPTSRPVGARDAEIQGESY